MKLVNGFLSVCGSLVKNVLIYVLGTVTLLTAWFYLADHVIHVLDYNLLAIKFVTSYMPYGYGGMIESALRVGLGFDKAILLLEATLLLRLVWFAITFLAFRKPSASKVKKPKAA